MRLLRDWEHLHGGEIENCGLRVFQRLQTHSGALFGMGLEFVIVFSDRPWIEGSLLLDKSENVLQISLYQCK